MIGSTTLLHIFSINISNFLFSFFLLPVFLSLYVVSLNFALSLYIAFFFSPLSPIFIKVVPFTAQFFPILSFSFGKFDSRYFSLCLHLPSFFSLSPTKLHLTFTSAPTQIVRYSHSYSTYIFLFLSFTPTIFTHSYYSPSIPLVRDISPK